MDDRPVLLVIVGALGDWAVRRVIIHARDFANRQAYAVDLLFVDVLSRSDILGEVARRLVQLAAEVLDHATIVVPVSPGEGDGPAVLTARPYFRPLLWDHDLNERTTLTKGVRLPDPPDMRAGDGAEDAMKKFIDDFFAKFVKEPTKQELEEVTANPKTGTSDPKAQEALLEAAKNLIAQRKKETLAQFQEIVGFLGGSITGEDGESVPRYWQSIDDGDAHVLEGLGTWFAEDLEKFCESYGRVIVYGATPPQVYPQILRTWASFAYRIAFEKPIDSVLGERRT